MWKKPEGTFWAGKKVVNNPSVGSVLNVLDTNINIFYSDFEGKKVCLMKDNSKSWYCFPQTAPWSFETVCHWPQDRADRCQHSYNWLECVWQETTPWNCKGSERIVTEQRQNTHGQISADLWGIEGSFWFGEWGIVASVDLFLLSETQNEWVSTIPKKYFREAQTNYYKLIIVANLHYQLSW